MTFALTIAFIFYGLLLLLLYIGWERATHRPVKSTEPSRNFLSVIIAVRNEEKNVTALLNNLGDQTYSKEFFEIIVVDDQSEDNTVKLLKEKSFNGRIIPATGKGKKAAIADGISHARGNIIVTTDADCHMSVHWLASVNQAFTNDSAKMIFGPVKIEPYDKLFLRMQALEFASLIGSGASTMTFGIPTMCNGANLAYRKEVFTDVKGYDGNENIASGDDEFLMRKIFHKYPKGVFFNGTSVNIVSTQPQETLSQFLLQRLRWAGKWKHHSDPSTKLLGLFIFVFHVSVILLPFVYYANRAAGDMLLAFFISKVILEYLFLHRVTSWLGIRWDWLSFILLQVLYPVYAIVIGIGSLFVSPVWKGRN
jgi:biofilm PGA synthesis N-glycosyltransferase PgaC